MQKLWNQIKNRANAIGILNGVRNVRGFLYNGHIDTIPVGSRDFWTVDPLKGVIKDGKIYGRGTGDMKGAGARAIIFL